MIKSSANVLLHYKTKKGLVGWHTWILREMSQQQVGRPFFFNEASVFSVFLWAENAMSALWWTSVCNAARKRKRTEIHSSWVRLWYSDVRQQNSGVKVFHQTRLCPEPSPRQLETWNLSWLQAWENAGRCCCCGLIVVNESAGFCLIKQLVKLPPTSALQSVCLFKGVMVLQQHLPCFLCKCKEKSNRRTCQIWGNVLEYFFLMTDISCNDDVLGHVGHVDRRGSD